jgi:hypothetical protein
MKRYFGLLIAALIASVVPLGATAHASAPAPASAESVARGTNAPCHGYVHTFKNVRPAHRVKLIYWVQCNYEVDFIQVQAFIREGDRFAYGGTSTCRNTDHCTETIRMRNRAGRQLYTARAVEGGDLADVTYVKDGDHDLWGCSTNGGGVSWGDPMNCTAAGHYW